MKFLAKITEKGLDLGSDHNRARFHDFCRKNVGKTVRIELPDPKRTLTQNAYYWVYLTVLEREFGNAADDLHDYFKHKFLPRDFVTIRGKKGKVTFERIKSTTKLSKLEFGEYLDKIAEATGVPLPNPQEAGYLPR